MDKPVILILGGYGNAGFSIADYLLKSTDCNLILAGRNADQARFAAGDLNAGYTSNWEYRVSSMVLHADHTAAVQEACKNANLLIVAAPVTAHINGILDALLASRTDALFISPHPAVQAALDARAAALQQAGICVIAQAGLFPGLPAALIRHYSPDVPALNNASVSLMRHLDWQVLKLSDDSLRDWLDIWRSLPQQVYRQGQWRNAQVWRGDYRKITFAAANQTLACVPQALPELQAICSQFKDLRSLDANLSRLNPFINWLVLPFAGKPPAEMSESLIKRLRWGLETLSQKPYQTQMQAVLHGRTAKHHTGNYQKTLYAQISHRNAYELTGIAVAACVKQYLSGELRKAGVWLQGPSVNTEQLLADMQALGVEVQVTTEVV